MSLTTQQLAGRARAIKQRKIKMLCSRLDSYVTIAEEMKPTTKGRLAWMDKAETVRKELRLLDH